MKIFTIIVSVISALGSIAGIINVIKNLYSKRNPTTLKSLVKIDNPKKSAKVLLEFYDFIHDQGIKIVHSDKIKFYRTNKEFRYFFTLLLVVMTGLTLAIVYSAITGNGMPGGRAITAPFQYGTLMVTSVIVLFINVFFIQIIRSNYKIDFSNSTIEETKLFEKTTIRDLSNYRMTKIRDISKYRFSNVNGSGEIVFLSLNGEELKISFSFNLDSDEISIWNTIFNRLINHET